MSGAIRATCGVCKTVCDDVRVRTDDGGFGPVDIQTCRDCHEKEMASVRAESRRFRMRLKTQRWESLTTNGAYSSVAAK